MKHEAFISIEHKEYNEIRQKSQFGGLGQLFSIENNCPKTYTAHPTVANRRKLYKIAYLCYSIYSYKKVSNFANFMKRDKKRANLQEFEETLKKGHLSVFSNEDIIRIFGWSKTSVKFLLHRYTKRGITTRLKNGLYAMSGATISEFYVANRLCEPSYISLETALSFHHIIPETVYAITSMTTRIPHERDFNGTSYEYHRVLARAFTGYKPTPQGSFTVLIAEPEKALVDHCYMAARGLRKPLDPERTRMQNLNKHKINTYARLFRNKKMMVLLEKLLSVKL